MHALTTGLTLLLICGADDSNQLWRDTLQMDWGHQVTRMKFGGLESSPPEPQVGYVGLWRSIYAAEQVSTERPPPRGFADGSGHAAADGETGIVRRTPRVRAARRVAIEGRFLNLPVVDSSGGSTFSGSADHSLKRDSQIWSPNQYATAPTTSPRDYVPNAVLEASERPRVEGQESNLLMTAVVSVVALVLLLVVVFMPR